MIYVVIKLLWLPPKRLKRFSYDDTASIWNLHTSGDIPEPPSDQRSFVCIHANGTWKVTNIRRGDCHICEWTGTGWFFDLHHLVDKHIDGLFGGIRFSKDILPSTVVPQNCYHGCLDVLWRMFLPLPLSIFSWLESMCQQNYEWSSFKVDINLIESIFKPLFSSTDSAVDVEVEFEHNLKPRKKRGVNVRLIYRWTKVKRKERSIITVKLLKFRIVILKKIERNVTVKTKHILIMVWKLMN